VNRYPTWAYVAIGIAILIALLYTVPNFYGESPAVQVAPGKATVKVDAGLGGRVEEALKKANLSYERITADASGVKVRLADADTQLRAYDALNQALNPEKDNPSYAVALNLLPASPAWLAAIKATPMPLGLDLRGGVHFLLQVNMEEAVKKRLEGFTADIRQQLRDKNIRHTGVSREGNTLRVRFADAGMRAKGYEAIVSNIPDLLVTERDDGLVATIRADALKRIRDSALKQNITTLNNRVNGLGV
jgi:preprotein translocase subunit SecD